MYVCVTTEHHTDSTVHQTLLTQQSTQYLLSTLAFLSVAYICTIR